MTGNKLAAAIAKFKGAVYVTANFTEETYVQVVKKDVIGHFRRKGSGETGLTLNEFPERAYISMDFDIAYAEIEKEIAERRY
jgi:hypothetical protein